jgi:methionyl-tRNA formyltransferase
MKENARIVFMGTPEFAVASLKNICDSGYNVVGVVTAQDKPAGRGQKIQMSAVKTFALERGLPIFQPSNLKDEAFIEELKGLHADLFLVVAFRMLPEAVWRIPRKGTINLHGSLLPQYRGAAPINWAIINGEKTTGVTTFFINEKIDTGNILFSEEIAISEDESAGELHDKMMQIGALLLEKTTNKVLNDNYKEINQSEIGKNANLRPAPKIFKEDCKLSISDNTVNFYNKIRGLSPYPASFIELVSEKNEHYFLKIFKAKKEISKHKLLVGSILTDKKTHLSIVLIDGFVHLQEIQLTSKKKMSISEFLRGFQIDERWSIM